MTCVCSLAGTAACASCSNNPNSAKQYSNFITWTNSAERTSRIAESRWHELFGTPERAARTLVNLNCDGSGCDSCSLGDIECNYGYTALLEWLRGDAE